MHPVHDLRLHCSSTVMVVHTFLLLATELCLTCIMSSRTAYVTVESHWEPRDGPPLLAISTSTWSGEEENTPTWLATGVFTDLPDNDAPRC